MSYYPIGRALNKIGGCHLHIVRKEEKGPSLIWRFLHCLSLFLSFFRPPSLSSTPHHVTPDIDDRDRRREGGIEVSFWGPLCKIEFGVKADCKSWLGRPSVCLPRLTERHFVWSFLNLVTLLPLFLPTAAEPACWSICDLLLPFWRSKSEVNLLEAPKRERY